MFLIVLDIDFFKCINDEFGYLVGDVVICELVVCLCIMLVGNGVIGCVGGEEFIILLFGVVLEQVVILVGWICQVIVGDCFQCLLVCLVIFSFGVVWVVVGSDFEEVYVCVDQVLYQVKCGGCNWVELEELVIG